MQLHQFHWLESEDLIGEIPHAWNHLVGYDQTVPADQVSALHYTEGGPYFTAYIDTDYADLWFEEKERANFAKN